LSITIEWPRHGEGPGDGRQEAMPLDFQDRAREHETRARAAAAGRRAGPAAPRSATAGRRGEQRLGTTTFRRRPKKCTG
jgi:hypothetical protein